MKNYTNHFFIFFTSLVFISNAFAGEQQPATSSASIRFTENKNQWDKKIQYRAELDGGVLFLEKNCFTYSFYDKEAFHENETPKNKKGIHGHAFKMTFLNALSNPQTSASHPTSDYNNYYIGNDKSKWASDVKNYTEVNYKNIYQNINLQIVGLQNSIKYNFYVAPQANANDIQLFYEGLKDIGLDDGSLKLTTSLNELVEQKPYAYQIIEGKQVKVPCEFVLKNATVHFNFPKGYNKNYELVIDPVLVFAATSGSTADNFGHCGTFDANGNLYSGSIAFDQGYPTTLGAYDVTFNGVAQYGMTDVAITKYDASGTFLQYSTYLGGATSTEIVTSLIVDAQNNLHLYGVTGSNDFPVTPNAFDPTFNGGSPYMPYVGNGNVFGSGTDIFVAEFNATGTNLNASTYIGGTNNDGVNSNNSPRNFYNTSYGIINDYTIDSLEYNYGDYYRGEIEIDKSGNVVIATSTRSSNFPFINGFDNSLGGQQDAVVFKMNSNLSQLIWSTYLGGSDNDCANSIELDNSSNVYVCGGTRSSDFSTTPGTLQTSFNGGKADGYVSKIKFDGSTLLSSTYWGTPTYDQCYEIQLDKSNNVYTFGQTDGAMPVTAGVYNNPNSGQFITKMDNSLTTVIYSTVFGNKNGVPNISPTAFLVDNCENIYVSGWATAMNTNRPPATQMPVTSNGLDTTTTGYDFYLMELSTNATSLVYATYFGGDQTQEHVHGGTSRYDKKGIMYQSLCTGCGGNDDFPGTPGSWPNTGTDWNHSNCNNGVFKLDFQTPLTIADFTVDYLQACAQQTIHFTNKSTNISTFLWDFGGGDTTSTVLNPIRTYNTPGTYLVKLFVNNPANCNVSDSIFYYITVNPLPSITNSTTNDTICSGDVFSKKITSSISSTFTWIAGDNLNTSGETITLQHTDSIGDVIINNTLVNQIVTYTTIPTSLSSNCNGASQTFTVTVKPKPVLSASPDTLICNNRIVNYSLSSNIPSTYKWNATNNPNTTGESTTSQTSNIINDVITNNSSAVQPITYTITPTSVSGNCAGNTITFTVNVNPTPIVSVNTNTTVCNNVNLNISLTSNVTSSFVWSTTDNPFTTGESTTNQNSNLINDIITNNSANTQQLTYTVTPTSTSGSCLGTPNTVTVTVIPTPTVTAISSTTVCSNVQLNISLNSNVASSFIWSSIDNSFTTGESTTNQNSNLINDVITNNSPNNQTLTYTVTPTSLTGNCIGTSKTIAVTIVPAPRLTINPDTIICSNTSLNTVLNSNVASTFSWIANNNINTTGESLIAQNSTIINDGITNNSGSLQSVIYSITPTSVIGNCLGSVQTYSVNVNPIPALSISNATSICSNTKINQVLRGNIPSFYSWQTSPNTFVTGESTTAKTSDTINDVITNTSPIIQTLTYTITPTAINGGCAGITQTYSVNVMPNVIAGFTYTHNACIHEATFTSTSSAATYLWDFGDGSPTPPSQNKVTHDFVIGGKYTVNLTIVANGCSNSYPTTIDFTDPVVSISQDTIICVYKQAQLYASGGISYNWLPTTDLNNPTVANPIANPSTTTTYTVNINATTPLGDICQQTLSTTVHVTNPVNFSITATTDKDTLMKGESTTVHAITNPTLTVTWNPSEGINNIHSFNPIVTPEVSTTYTVSILDAEGCPKTATVSIVVISNTCDNSDIFIPNTFTPNGDDNNDILFVRGNNITELYFAVYNRWGQKVFETTDIKKGWDGIYNDMKSDPVVFAWYVKAKCYNGNTIEKKGNVTLLR